MPNQYSAPPPGKIWVPTPNGLVAMTLEEARAYKTRTTPSGGLSLANLNSPDLSEDIRQKLHDPRVLVALGNHETRTVQVGDTAFQIQNGVVTHYSKGSVWKPVLAAGAVAASGGLAGIYAAGAGAGTAGGTAAGLGPATATNLADTAAIASGATVPGSLAALTPAELATVGGSAAAGGGAAAALGPSTPASLAETAHIAAGGTVPASLTSAGVPATPSVSSWLGGTGRFLGSPGGATLAGVAGNLIGAGIQSSANTKAAEIAAQTAREALAYEKQRDTYAQQLEASRYGDLTGRLAPYISTGQNASARMAAILGLPAPDPATTGAAAPTPMGLGPAATYQTRPGLETSPPAGGTAMPRPGGSLVAVRAPTGQIAHLTPDQAALAQQRGAQIVG